MKILESQSAVLSNYEVLAHLTESRTKPRTTPQTHSNVSTVLKEVSTCAPSESTIFVIDSNRSMPTSIHRSTPAPQFPATSTRTIAIRLSEPL
ncbi:hypothetical protein N7G274_005010 [Stereocaulon virgatum]|uniref:Uncharacterized protein n=1 Tax=Stereocaulon virgatum TaxID=373712 RepID=A0ABR4ACE0_9LECA